MRCPFCQEPENKVIDSRESHEGSVVRRRRECLRCKRRFTTYERVEELFPLLEETVVAIERMLQGAGEKEVRSSLIGEEVMRRLQALDEVAYVRFASVYRSFRDISEFMEELKELLADRSRERQAQRPVGKDG
jgi:transcriptional repressor NrdR